MSPEVLSASDTSASPQTDLLWSFLLRGATITGRQLFDNDHRSLVSEEINAVRKRDNINHRKHAGMLNAKMKSMWEDLKDRQKEWEDKAAALKASELKGLVYRCVSSYSSIYSSLHLSFTGIRL